VVYKQFLVFITLFLKFIALLSPKFKILKCLEILITALKVTECGIGQTTLKVTIKIFHPHYPHFEWTPS